ncbi:hypothetical protein SDC9_52877 [bioreactor metagenome]|uniref:Secretion system C-terminal sorting domain-containing protein n=1 Tax=bioreactor metagenome TaxID=1076179 RepID=A0A644WRP8_9ZZZZ
MKKIISLFACIVVIGLISVSAQNVKYMVKASNDCTNLTTEFTIPAGQSGKLMSMELTTSFNTCNASQPAPTENYVKVYAKSAGANAKGKALYKKTVDNQGNVTESTPIQDVKLNPGAYIIEVSKAPGLQAELEVHVD